MNEYKILNKYIDEISKRFSRFKIEVKKVILFFVFTTFKQHRQNACNAHIKF